MRLSRWLMIFSLLLVVGLWTAISQSPAAAQCSIRADWASYTVRWGDSLSQIARRYSITLNQLMQANCLTSTRIFAGQSLRVPPVNSPQPTQVSSVQFPSSGFGSYYVQSNIREFQNGFMIYRGDNSGIWVVDRNSGRITEYSSLTYGQLPVPRDLATPLPGCYPVVLGFAQVWYNMPGVRAALGCSILPGEQTFQMFLQSPSFGNYFLATVALREGTRTLRIERDGRWSFTNETLPTGLPTESSSPRIGTTFQGFENGFMIWRADTGEIYTYIGTDNTGALTIYSSSQYAQLPLDNRVIVPAGRFVPQNGFGRVWTNYARAAIGWAITTEQGYLMTPVVQNGALIQFNLPDGRYARWSATGWSISSSFAPSPTAPPPVVTATLTPTLVATAATPVSTSTTGAAYQPFQNGFMIWRQDTGDVLVFESLNSSGSVWPYSEPTYSVWEVPVVAPPGDAGPGLVVPVNAFGKVWSQVRDRMGWGTAPEQGYTATVMNFNQPGYFPYTHITLPDGRTVFVNLGRSSWSFVN